MFMNGFVRLSLAAAIGLFLATPAIAQENGVSLGLHEWDLGIDLSSSDIILAANGGASTYRTAVPNIPDSAFEKPAVTENNLHMYLGLASLAMGGVAAMTVPKDQTDLLNTFHYKAAKASWQLGAMAVGTGLYSHWNDFFIADGLLDRDNLHALLGLLGTLGYYLAVQSAVSDYNNKGAVTKDHASSGMLGGGAMTIAIALTW